VAQQALHAAVLGRLEASVASAHLVEVRACLEHAHEELPLRTAVLRLRLSDRVVRPQRLTVLGQRELKLVWHRCFVRPGVVLGGEAPSQHRACEDLEVRDAGLGGRVRVDGALGDALPEQQLPGAVASVQHDTRLDQRRRRHDETCRLYVAEPLEVSEDFGGDFRLRHQLLSGQR